MPLDYVGIWYDKTPKKTQLGATSTQGRTKLLQQEHKPLF